MSEQFQQFDASALLKEEEQRHPVGMRSTRQAIGLQPCQQEGRQVEDLQSTPSLPSLETLLEPAIAEEAAAVAAADEHITGRAFHGQVTQSATYNPLKEAPHHRAICIQLAQGFTPKEVAEMTGFHTVTIQYVRKQPWAQKFIAELMERAGRKIVMNELQGAALDAARLIVKSVRGELGDHKQADRCKDAHKLLDRLYGVAPQTLLHGNIDPNELSDEELATIATGTGK